MTDTKQISFPLGRIVMTPGVIDLWYDETNVLGRENYAELMDAIRRHKSCDWGDVDTEDWQANNSALRVGLRLVSYYKVGGERVLIITEWDRSVTTCLLISEY